MNYQYPAYYPTSAPYAANPQQQANIYQPQPQTPPQAIPSAVRTVYSEAEARAAQIPTDGSTVVFIDQTSGALYTKQFSFETGSFPFFVYARQTQAPTQYATLEDLERLRRELMEVRTNDE